MSINVTVHGNPISIKRGKMVLSDLETVKNKEVERRRKLRLEQVRQQSKDIASNIREKVKGETKKQLSELEKKRSDELKRWQSRRLLHLHQQYNECLHEFGSGHRQAALQPDAERILKNENKNNLKASLERGKTATRQLNLQRQQEDLEKSKPIKRKKFSREVENVRSSMVSSLNKKNYKSKSPFKSKKKKNKVLAHIDVSANPTTEETDSSEYSENDENIAPSPSLETEEKKKNVSKNSTVHITIQRESGSTSEPKKGQSEPQINVFSETDRSQNDSKTTTTSEESSSARRSLVVSAQVRNDHLNNKNLITSALDISVSSHEEEPKNIDTNTSSYNPRYYQETGIGNKQEGPKNIDIKTSSYNPRYYQETGIGNIHTLQPDSKLSYESTRNREPKNVFYDPRSYEDSTSKTKARVPIDTRISDLIARRQKDSLYKTDDKFDICNCDRCHSPLDKVRLCSDRTQSKCYAGSGQAVNCHCSKSQFPTCDQTEQNVRIEPCTNATNKHKHSFEFITVPDRNQDDYSSGKPYNVEEDVLRKTYRLPNSKIGYLSKINDNENISDEFIPEDKLYNAEKRTFKTISNPDPKISDPPKSCSCDCKTNPSISPMKLKQSPNKNVKQTSPSIQSQPIPSDRSKVQYYDHDNRFAHEYNSRTNLVQRIDSENVDRIIAEENDEKEAILTRDAKRKQEAIQRGKSAMQKDKIHRDYNELLKQLSVLQRKERLLQQRPNDPHLSEQRLQEKAKSKQKRIETAFERLYHNQIPIITLDTVERPETRNQNVEFETVDLSSGAEPVLNVASWDTPRNVNVGRSEHTLQVLLDNIRRERQLLMDQIQSLPATSNFNENDNNSDELKNVTEKSENESSANSSMASMNNSKIDGDTKSVLDNGQKKSPSTGKSEKKPVQTEQKQKKSKTKKQSKSKPSTSEKDETCNSKQEGVLKSDAKVQTSFNNIYEQPEKDSSRSIETSPTNSSNNAYKGPEIIIKVDGKDKCQTIIVGPSKKKYVCTTEQRKKSYKIEEISKPKEVITREQKDQSPTYNEIKDKTIEQPSYSQQKENLDPTLSKHTKVEKNNISSGTSTTYMSPPQHISVDSSSSNQIDNNKKQLSKLDPEVQRLINKLLTMSKRSVDELGVSSVSEISTPDFSLVCTSPNMPKAMSNVAINQSSILETTPRLDVTNFMLASANSNSQTNVQINSVESRQNKSLSQLRKSIQGENLQSLNMVDESTLNRLLKNYKEPLETKIDYLTSIINAMRSEREKYEINLTGSDKELHPTTYLDLPGHEQSKHQTSDEIIIVTSPKKQVHQPQTKTMKQDNLDGIEIDVQHINLISEPSTSRQGNVLLAKSTLTEYEKNVVSTKTAQPFIPILQGIPKIKQQNGNLPEQNASVKFDFSSSGSSTLFLPKAESSHLPQMNLISSTESSFESNGNQQPKNAAPTLHQRPKPPTSLQRSVLKHNIDSDSIVVHELSTIVEVDTPAASKNVSRFSEHGRKKEELTHISSTESLSEILAKLENTVKEMEIQEYQGNVSENERVLDKLSDFKLLSSNSDSTSTPDHLEALLHDLGLSWAMSTLKKTEQTQALSSSSSSQDVSFAKLGIKFSFNSSNGNSSGNTKDTSEEFKEFRSTSFDDTSSPSMPQLIVRKTPEFVPLESEKKDVSKRQQSSREKSQGRTSTPVVDISIRCSQSEGHGELFTGESDISSVNPVANTQNIALTVPNLSLNIERSRKNHSSSSNS